MNPTDVSCCHGSRWIWWYNDLEKRGKWMNVVWALNCDCDEPSPPYDPELRMK